MKDTVMIAESTEIKPLIELSERVGRDPLLTQASTGNSSVKAGDVLWIKASGKCMADAAREDFLLPLPLEEVRRSIRDNIDPRDRYPKASIETAMHAVLPHPVVLHVHCADTVAWVVREDAWEQLERRLNGLPARWFGYVQSGLPLARKIESCLTDARASEVLLLGNHGLVIAGQDCETVERLLGEVRRRLASTPRAAHPPDYAALTEVAEQFGWTLPEDDSMHSMATDVVSAGIIARGFLYPCQSILSHAAAPEIFRAVDYAELMEPWATALRLRPFLLIAGRGMILNPIMTASERALLAGLSQVVQRIDRNAPLRYLTDQELSAISSLYAASYLGGSARTAVRKDQAANSASAASSAA